MGIIKAVKNLVANRTVALYRVNWDGEEFLIKAPAHIVYYALNTGLYGQGHFLMREVIAGRTL